MIINKIPAATPSPPPRTKFPSSIPSQSQQPLPVKDESLKDSMHFDDRHFSSQRQAHHKYKVSSLQPTTVIRKYSTPQNKSSKKDIQNEQNAILRQAFASFLHPIDSFDKITPQNNYSQGNYRNYSSCSMRRKHSSVCSSYPSRQLLPAAKIAEEQVPSNRSGSCFINPSSQAAYLHKRKVSDGARQSKFNTLDYNIIKPHEIQAVPLSYRHESKSKNFNRSNCPDLLATLRKKEEILRRHMQYESQRQQIRIRKQNLSNRTNIHTSFMNRRTLVRFQDSNQVLPWEVDLNLADII